MKAEYAGLFESGDYGATAVVEDRPGNALKGRVLDHHGNIVSSVEGGDALADEAIGHAATALSMCFSR